MLVKNQVYLEFVKEDRKYKLVMPVNAPLGEVYQATGAFMDEIIRLINEHAQQRKEIENSVNPVQEEAAAE